MSALDPSAPSQPTQQTGLDQAQNPASKTSKEQSDSKVPTEGQTIDHREQHDVPSNHGEEATASSLGYGDTGPLKEKSLPGSDAQKYSKDGNLEGEQMRAPGEGEVAEAVRTGGGGGHKSDVSMMENIEDKKQEHADELHKRGEKTAAEQEAGDDEDWTGKKAEVDVGEALAGSKIVLAADN